MKYSFTKRFIRSYRNFPQNTQKKFDKQLKYLLADLKYPSLKAKRFDESLGVWQARVDRGIRFYFLIQKDTYIILDIQHHPK